MTQSQSFLDCEEVDDFEILEKYSQNTKTKTQTQSFLNSDDDEYLSSIDLNNLPQKSNNSSQVDTNSQEFQYAQIIPTTQTSRIPNPKPPIQQLQPVKKKNCIIRADILEPGFVYFSHLEEAEQIYRANSGIIEIVNSRQLWKIPFKNYRRVITALKNPSNSFTAILDLPPDSIFQSMFTFRPQKLSLQVLNNLPERLQSSLYPHQKESVLYAASRHFRVFIADDMGLGKTIEAVAIACATKFPKESRVVVLAPNHLVSTWVDAFLKWTNICQSNINIVLKTEKISPKPLLIASYSAAVRLTESIQSLDYDLVIVDESHEIKNVKTQIYQKISPILSKSKYLVLLSGTPMTRPSELYPQIRLLLPQVFPSFKDFGARYCHGEFNSFGHFETTGCTHSEELKTVLENLIMLRREKDAVLTDLPVKKRFHVMLNYTPSPAMKEQVEQMRIHRIALATGMETMKAEQNTIMTTAFSLTGIDKLPAVIDWLRGSEFRRTFLIENRKCLIFAFHRNVLEGLTKWITDQELQCITIMGSTPRDQRDFLFREFKMNPDCKIAVLSIEIASTGITLTEASLVVFAEFKWTPSDHQQAENRVHRIGQNRDVEIYYLHAEGSLDDRIWEILERKLAVISSVISSKTKTFETDTNAK